jgi:peptidoglycan/LPS O-acetylase OafA/YrhL
MQTSQTKSEYVHFLDGLRAIAVLSVILFRSYQKYGQMAINTNSHAKRVLHAMFGNGWLGVDLFFVISGFLITGILLKCRGRDGYFRKFYAARATRILPACFAYIACLPLVERLLPDSYGPPLTVQSMLWAFTALTNVQILLFGRDAIPENLVHLWSLSVEQHFYLFWPAVVAWVSPKRLLPVVVVLICLIGIFRIPLYMYDCVTYFQTFCRADSLLMGAFVSLWLSRSTVESSAEHAASDDFPRFRFGPLVVFAVLTVATGITVFFTEYPSHRDWRFQTFGYSLSAALFASLVFGMQSGAVGFGVLRSFFSLPMFRGIAKYSYAMYLWHMPFVIPAASLIQSPTMVEVLPNSAVLKLLILTACLTAIGYVVAIISFRLVEKPALGLRRYLE